MTGPVLPGRLIFSGPSSGAWNMAVDEVLLESALRGISSLRFYEWSSPTVSLGHFQGGSRAGVPARFHSLDAVRRLSGGGAILHDRELTYACALPASHPAAREPGSLYDKIHAAIIEVLARYKVAARLRGSDSFPDKPFLCFARGDPRDILIGGSKIVGSAQRRRQGAVLQHGSILLEQSSLTPEFSGIAELSDRKIAAADLAQQLAPAIAACLGIAFTPTPLDTHESERAVQRQESYLVL